jgi:hypothetical protein
VADLRFFGFGPNLLEVAMKPFSLLKLPVMLVGFGAALMLAPACKAQSEVSPDRFDGSDSWEAAVRKSAPAAKAKPAATLSSTQAQNKKADSGPKVEMAAVREVSKPGKHEAVPVQDKRKTAPRKPDNE